jgi:hypothetical protein
LETTDRPDVGIDLNAPEVNEEGKSYWSYDFVREVAEGDLVFHYETPSERVAFWSRAVGQPYQAEVVWGAHGQASGRGPVAPYPRPGWRRSLDGPFPLSQPVTLRDLQAREDDLARIYSELRERVGGSVYFPFQLSRTRPMRGAQAYLTKLPRAVVEAVPELSEAARLAAQTRPLPSEPAPAVDRTVLGISYREQDEETSVAGRDPYTVDPDLVDRALRGHANTQNALARAVSDAGFVPRSPAPGEPFFDLAWEENGTIVVAEVKSLSGSNEERQLRLALGQVLRYGHLLGRTGKPIRRIIAVAREPADSSWISLCASAGVALAWPGTFASVVGRPE